MEDFHCSEIVASLGLALYVLGCEFRYICPSLTDNNDRCRWSWSAAVVSIERVSVKV